MSSHARDKREYHRKEYEAYVSKQYPKSIVLFIRALNRAHEKSTCYNLATSYYRIGDYHKAIKKYRLAAIIDPKFQQIYNAWGSCLSHLGRYDEAILKFQKTLEIDSNYELAYLNWGLVLFWQEKKLEAEEIIREGLEKKDFPQDVLVSLYKMELSSVEGRLEKASNEEERKFLEGRIVGYNWMLELVEKIFMEKTLKESEYEEEF